MAHQSELIAEDILAYLKSQEEKTMLRFITCGSVDDGKSTLIGRLLWDSKMVFEDQLAALAADSKRVGTQGEKIDYALLLDGLQAEREQGITIDVAYRFFSTDRRKFIVADTPGHEQYTRNMVTGASTAQVAVILIDARKGVLTQSRRHSYLVSLVGIRQVVLAINKMDLVDYSQERFEEIRREYEHFAASLGFDAIAAIPISALEGDNVLTRSDRTPWYAGPTLMEHLDTVPIADADAGKPFRLRVQWVNRPNLDFRGFCGTIASGSISAGETVIVSASGQTSRVARIVTMDGDLEKAGAGQAVTLTLADEIDISRGDLLATPDARPCQSDRFEAKVVWMHEEPLHLGRSYLIKAGATTAPVTVSALRFKVNVNTLEEEPGETLSLNEVGACTLTAGRTIPFDPYGENRGTGNFILIDRLSNATVGAGMIEAPLQKAVTLAWPTLTVDKDARSGLKGQTPKVLWFAGRPSAGKSTVAALVEKRLLSLGKHTYLLDGDTLRQGLNADLGASGSEEEEIRRRIVEVARILADAGLIVLASDSGRGSQIARERFAPGEFSEIFIDTAADVCASRSGGVNLPYKPPEAPDFTVDGADAPEEIALTLVRLIFGEPPSCII
ncbi:adenylylsulfate kinase [Desulfuromonas soudanensis]|uniref:Sulfate adenylyltransferase subunit 1 n=1 Tax=Desulfuromonas soudanensis TaxID=1603606 RepID=A0A0M4D927_9BACT|nr:sulfate adenylyltransferase subunit CysN [Desulfuromonas soudanensis]ALC17935.1 adenylylsulfate kinase [Desulfuromonas soudanensis]